MSSSKKCTFSDDMMEVLQDKRAPLSSFPRCKKKLETVRRRSDETIAVVTYFSKVEDFKSSFYQDVCPKNCPKYCSKSFKTSVRKNWPKIVQKLAKEVFKSCPKIVQKIIQKYFR